MQCQLRHTDNQGKLPTALDLQPLTRDQLAPPVTTRWRWPCLRVLPRLLGCSWVTRAVMALCHIPRSALYCFRRLDICTGLPVLHHHHRSLCAFLNADLHPKPSLEPASVSKPTEMGVPSSAASYQARAPMFSSRQQARLASGRSVAPASQQAGCLHLISSGRPAEQLPFADCR